MCVANTKNDYISNVEGWAVNSIYIYTYMNAQRRAHDRGSGGGFCIASIATTVVRFGVPSTPHAHDERSVYREREKKIESVYETTK